MNRNIEKLIHRGIMGGVIMAGFELPKINIV